MLNKPRLWFFKTAQENVLRQRTFYKDNQIIDVVQDYSYILLVFGHRSLVKNTTQTAAINIFKPRNLLNLTFRMQVVRLYICYSCSLLAMHPGTSCFPMATIGRFTDVKLCHAKFQF